MPKSERQQLIKDIEALRGSRVITYICSDRQNAAANIGNDAVRTMYENIRKIGKVEKIDLFLYSLGGSVEVPWRLVSMLREYCDHLSVLIPYSAMSAATMIAIGCDEIVLGPKAELGPIDPGISRLKFENGIQYQEEIRVEDVMAYVSFLKDKGGLTDQAVLKENIHLLAEKLTPQFLGNIYRTHSYIRQVALKLLSSHTSKLDPERVEAITQVLSEKTYAHGHNITRYEAKEIGLPVSYPDANLEEKMWQLLVEYENMLELRKPLDLETTVPVGQDYGEFSLVMAVIESNDLLQAFRGTLCVTRYRQQVAAYNLNLNIPLPAGVDPANPDPQQRQQLEAFMQQMQIFIQTVVQQQINAQSPVIRTDGRLKDARWQDITLEMI